MKFRNKFILSLIFFVPSVTFSQINLENAYHNNSKKMLEIFIKEHTSVYQGKPSVIDSIATAFCAHFVSSVEKNIELELEDESESKLVNFYRSKRLFLQDHLKISYTNAIDFKNAGTGFKFDTLYHFKELRYRILDTSLSFKPLVVYSRFKYLLDRFLAYGNNSIKQGLSEFERKKNFLASSINFKPLSLLETNYRFDYTYEISQIVADNKKNKAIIECFWDGQNFTYFAEKINGVWQIVGQEQGLSND